MINSEFMKQNAVGIAIQGDMEAVSNIMEELAKRFAFIDDKVTVVRGDENTARIDGIIYGVLKKKYRKNARVYGYDMTITDD